MYTCVCMYVCIHVYLYIYTVTCILLHFLDVLLNPWHLSKPHSNTSTPCLQVLDFAGVLANYKPGVALGIQVTVDATEKVRNRRSCMCPTTYFY
jgi:hypothetical protein